MQWQTISLCNAVSFTRKSSFDVVMHFVMNVGNKRVRSLHCLHFEIYEGYNSCSAGTAG